MGEARGGKLSEANQIKDLDSVRSSAWPLANARVQAQLEKEFSRLGIDFRNQGSTIVSHFSKPRPETPRSSSHTHVTSRLASTRIWSSPKLSARWRSQQRS